MKLDYYFLYFIIMSAIGYVYETAAMTFWGGKWDNRGFLFGPIIPIYGVGSVIGTLIFTYVIKDYTIWQVFLGGFLGSVILEYPTSYILEKLFHAVWWDYSSAPLNINGRVSLLSSIGFGIGAIIIVYLINPFLLSFLDNMNPVIMDVSSFILLMIFSADITFTVSVISDFEDRIANIDSMINNRLDNVVENMNPKGKKFKNVFNAGVDNVDKIVSSLGSKYHRVIGNIKRFNKTGLETFDKLNEEVKNKIDDIRDKNER